MITLEGPQQLKLIMEGGMVKDLPVVKFTLSETARFHVDTHEARRIAQEIMDAADAAEGADMNYDQRVCLQLIVIDGVKEIHLHCGPTCRVIDPEVAKALSESLMELYQRTRPHAVPVY